MVLFVIVLEYVDGVFFLVACLPNLLADGRFLRRISPFSVGNQFSLHFKDPLLYSEDLLALLKLQASEIWRYEPGQHWRYLFRKIDAQGRVIQPGVEFYFDLKFNEKEQLVRWDFSSLFLEIAPAEFLEVSLRSLAGAKNRSREKTIKSKSGFHGDNFSRTAEKTANTSAIRKACQYKR
jgi:hypothetical protein